MVKFFLDIEYMGLIYKYKLMQKNWYFKLML
jgi:hypothetical protein